MVMDNMNRKIIHIAFLTILLLAWNSLAQDAGSVKQEVRRIVYRVRLLQNALPLIPDVRIRQQLRIRLTTIQNELRLAEELVKKRQYKQGLEHIRIARQLLMQVETQILRQTRLNIQIRNKLDFKIKRAEKVVQQNPNTYARQLLEQAKLYRDKALSAYRQHSIFQAVEYFRLADYFASNAIDLATQRSVDIQQLYQKARMLLQEFRHSSFGVSPEGHSLVQRFKQQLEEIHQLITSGKEETARARLKSFFYEIYRYFSSVQTPANNEKTRLQGRWETVQQNLRTIASEIEISQDPVGKRLLQQAQNIAREVENAFRQGSLRLARKKMELLVRLLYQMDQRLQRRQRASNINTKLEANLKSDLAFTRQAVDRLKQEYSGDTGAFVTLLESLLYQAEQRLQNNRYLQASYYLKVANQLVLKFYQLRSETKTPRTVPSTEALNYLNRLKALLNRIEQENKPNVTWQAAQEIYRTATSMYQKGKYLEAKALSDYAIRLLTK